MTEPVAECVLPVDYQSGHGVSFMNLKIPSISYRSTPKNGKSLESCRATSRICLSDFGGDISPAGKVEYLESEKGSKFQSGLKNNRLWSTDLCSQIIAN